MIIGFMFATLLSVSIMLTVCILVAKQMPVDYPEVYVITTIIWLFTIWCFIGWVHLELMPELQTQVRWAIQEAYHSTRVAL